MIEIVKTNKDLPRLIENDLLKAVNDVKYVTSLANNILIYKCNERFKIRIGPGNTEIDFKCRKIHPVCGNPDPTKHSYVSIKVNYQKETLNILETFGISKDGVFNHPCFDPKHHIPPYNCNTKCKMSPVISDCFIALKLMQNDQTLDHTNGLTKYVCKYIAKFDESNYTSLLQDIYTGDWVNGKIHLHNTKIIRSKINEDKAFTKGGIK